MIRFVFIATIGGELTYDTGELVRDSTGDDFRLVFFISELRKLKVR